MELNDAARIIETHGDIVVFTGAGISTGSGIPDFRGENGLYKTVQKKYGLPTGESLFDISCFDRDPRPFFDFSREMMEKAPEPTLCHRLIGLWEREGRVSRVITQNIDRLHQKGGSRNIFECHGTYETGHCRQCDRSYGFDDYGPSMMEGEIPRCSCGGVIKPDVVFFGENLPGEFYSLWENPPVAGLVLILGTSLNVRPASDLVLKIIRRSSSLLVNLGETDYDRLMTHVLHEDLEIFAGRMASYFNLEL